MVGGFVDELNVVMREETQSRSILRVCVVDLYELVIVSGQKQICSLSLSEEGSFLPWAPWWEEAGWIPLSGCGGLNAAALGDFWGFRMSNYMNYSVIPKWEILEELTGSQGRQSKSSSETPVKYLKVMSSRQVDADFWSQSGQLSRLLLFLSLKFQCGNQVEL